MSSKVESETLEAQNFADGATADVQAAKWR